MTGGAVKSRGRYDLYRGQTPGQTLGPYFHQGLLRTKSWFQVPRVCEDTVDVISHVLAGERTPGERLRLAGNVYDGQGAPVSDALVELWQADAQGHYQHPLQASHQPIDPVLGSRVSLSGPVLGGPVLGGPVLGGPVLGGPVLSDPVPSGPVLSGPVLGGPAFRGFGRAATDDSGAFSFVTIKPGLVSGPRGSVQASHLNIILGARGLARHAFTRVYFEGDAELAHDPVLSLVPAGRRHTLIARRAGAGSSEFRFDIHLQGENETVFFEI